MSDTLTLYKLIILYMLDKVNFPLTNGQLSEFIIDKKYTDYFHVQLALSELVETKLVQVELVRNTSYYQATEEGLNTLSYFKLEISDSIRSEIDQFITDNSYELRSEVASLADYYRTDQQEYAVHCVVKEGKQNLIDLTILMPSEESAKLACDNWKKKSQEVYASIISKLL